MLSVIMLSVVMLSVVMLSVVAPSQMRDLRYKTFYSHNYFRILKV